MYLQKTTTDRQCTWKLQMRVFYSVLTVTKLIVKYDNVNEL